MSQRRTNRLGQSNSAQLHQLLADYNAALMIGAANSAWIPCALFTWDDPVAHPFDGGSITIRNTGATNFVVSMLVPLSTNRGGKKLYIKGIGVSVLDSDAGDYVDRARLFGMNFNSLTPLQDIDFDTVHGTAPGEFTDSFAADDISSYKQVVITLNFVVTNANDLDISSITADCYYDD